MLSKMPTYVTQTKVHSIIKEVKKRECLWNPEDENYLDRQHVVTAWNEMHKTLNLPKDLLRTKWKNLRDLFRREIKKFKVNSLADYTGKWRYFHELWFLHREEKDQKSDILEEQETIIKIEPLSEYHGEHFDEPENRDTLEEDFDLMFLKSLTPYLKQLEPMRQLVVRSKIQDILMNELAAQNCEAVKLGDPIY